ncbi:CRISPR-associated protein [Lactobacillus koreensis] [Lactiplantibacillus mudanjiangensis]|uniref:type I-E CRISPR-associated protein Cas7/Cse4/CasC n=1 Tax=Lactiplantibacillus mudanjiangensis TaxID=1296538 RepID=UPI001013E722|nr:CRISPR-associated protein [Lactobacillus koreensis] [Lactiplantibacillus mudanjiangensis]
MTKQVYIDLHILQTVPSSNINRDDTGAPKTAMYGGVMRSRVSSQSWKRVVRQVFKADNINIGTRTKKVATLLKEALKERDSALDDEMAMSKAKAVLEMAKIKFKDDETKALLLVSRGQINKLAQYVIDNEEPDKAEVKKLLKGDQSLDLALFGRMVADNPELNVDASAQVAHAISTHEVVPEYDYFTALDEKQGDEESGAAMLGTIDFNSATLYRYANVNMRELVENLDTEDAIHGAIDFIKDFVLSMPTGKQNTFANKTLPSYVMVTIRTDTPVNLVSAFENPVVSDNGYMTPSIKRLEAEYKATLGLVDQPLLNVIVSKTDAQVGDQMANLTELLEKVSVTLSEVVQDENTND